MKEIEGNEHIDFFSQDTILDYIDGRLSEQDKALFEQQMQEDEMLQLSVEGIKGFYSEEQKGRPYLESLMTQSEENLKQALVEVENAPTIVALNTKRRNRNIIGISIAACVALLMVFSLPRLLDDTQTDQNASEVAVNPTSAKEQKNPDLPEKPKVADSKETEENAAQTGPGSGEVTTSGNADMFKREDVIAFGDKKTATTNPEKKNIDGGAVNDTEKIVEDEMMPPVSKGFIPEVKKTDKVSEKSQEQPKSPGNAKNTNKVTLEREHINTDFLSKKEVDKKMFKRSKAKGSPRRRKGPRRLNDSPAPTYSSRDKRDESKVVAYRAPGKLYLWIYTDEQNMEYFRMQNLGREIADNTGLELVLTQASTQAFLNQKWKKFLRKQQLKTNDVVWVYYLGKNIPTTKINRYNKQSVSNRTISQLNNSVNDLSRRLERSNVALKIVTVDNGSESQPAIDDNSNTRQNVNQNMVPYTQQGISQVGKSLPRKNEVYKKLFLANTGIITILNSEPGRNVYQGVFTNNLVQSLKSAYLKNDPNIDWSNILNKTTTLTEQSSQKLGRPQEIQQRKMKVKKSY